MGKSLVVRSAGYIDPVTVEYTARGKRVRKVLRNCFVARSFYIKKFKAGADPKVIKPETK